MGTEDEECFVREILLRGNTSGRAVATVLGIAATVFGIVIVIVVATASSREAITAEIVNRQIDDLRSKHNVAVGIADADGRADQVADRLGTQGQLISPTAVEPELAASSIAVSVIVVVSAIVVVVVPGDAGAFPVTLPVVFRVTVTVTISIEGGDVAEQFRVVSLRYVDVVRDTGIEVADDNVDAAAGSVLFQP